MVGRAESTVQSSRRDSCGRRVVLIFLAALPVACADAGDSPKVRPQDLSASAIFRESEDTIEVRGFGRWPLERAELLMPDGGVVTALDIVNEATAGISGLRPAVGIGGSGGSRSRTDVGVGISFPILGGGATPPSIASRASFTILDMATYRATWRLWQVRLRFAGSGGEPIHLELPAPEPPSRSERNR